jgi:hypothetical protein
MVLRKPVNLVTHNTLCHETVFSETREGMEDKK